MTLSKDERQARMAALRDWYEGGTPSFSKLAAASGFHVSTIKGHAALHNWTKRPGGGRRILREAEPAPDGIAADDAAGAAVVPSGSTEERLARVMDVLLREVEAVGVAAQARGRPLDKGRIDALGAMIRTLEKFEGFARERAKEGQTGRDGEMGDVLRRIDERIVELAKAHAEELVARRIAAGELVEAERFGAGSGADPG